MFGESQPRIEAKVGQVGNLIIEVCNSALSTFPNIQILKRRKKKKKGWREPVRSSVKH